MTMISCFSNNLPSWDWIDYQCHQRRHFNYTLIGDEYLRWEKGVLYIIARHKTLLLFLEYTAFKPRK